MQFEEPQSTLTHCCSPTGFGYSVCLSVLLSLCLQHWETLKYPGGHQDNERVHSGIHGGNKEVKDGQRLNIHAAMATPKQQRGLWHWGSKGETIRKKKNKDICKDIEAARSVTLRPPLALWASWWDTEVFRRNIKAAKREHWGNKVGTLR